MPKTMESGDNDEIAKTHWQNFKNLLLKFQPNLAQIILRWNEGDHISSKEGLHHFPKGDKNKLAKIQGWYLYNQSNGQMSIKLDKKASLGEGDSSFCKIKGHFNSQKGD